MDDTNQRPPCVKGAVSEADWGIVRFRHITIPPSRLRRATSLGSREALTCCFQHVLDENTISSLWIIYQNMGHSAHQLAVLNDRRAGHECVKCRTKLFSIFSDIFLKYVEKPV